MQLLDAFPRKWEGEDGRLKKREPSKTGPEGSLVLSRCPHAEERSGGVMLYRLAGQLNSGKYCFDFLVYFVQYFFQRIFPMLLRRLRSI